ncbi:biotin/lipoyl-binding protein [bacterium]|nr:biotin/lipoyl-binding protein [bacterium]
MKIYRFKIFGHNFETKVIRRNKNELVISVNGQEYQAFLEQRTTGFKPRPTAKVKRPEAIPGEATKITAKPTESKGAGVIKAPMPGLIVKINVKQGDTVKSGQNLVVIEAMKMQNAIQATIDGLVKSIAVKEGDSVLERQELVVIE